MKYLIVLVMLFTSVAQATTYTLSTKVKKIRTVSEFNPVVNARGYIPFQVVATLEGGCTWLYLTPEAKDSYSLLLAAKIADKKIGIQYSDTGSPWHGATCQVHHLDLN